MKKETKKIIKGRSLIKEISLYKSFIWALVFSGFILLFDVNGIPSYYIKSIGKESMNLILIFLLIMFFIVLSKRHIFDLIKIPCGNIIDELLFFVLFSSLIISLFEIGYSTFYLYKKLALFFSTLLSIIGIIVRLCFFKIKEKNSNSSLCGIVDLYYFLHNDYEKKGRPLMFSEESSDYDLLDREGIINIIYNSIKYSNPKQGYVIGLKGAWGSGKTTILNLVKKKIIENRDNIIVIDDFDPWIFGSQEALLIAMYDEILVKSGIKYSSYSSRSIVKKLKEVLTSQYKITGVIDKIFNEEVGDYETLKLMKYKVSNFLIGLDKTIVFMIDNIDRAETDNIVFLFKLIGAVFDLPNIVYVLSYDEDRINHVFSNVNKINPKYIEKIVQQEVVVPEISKEAIQKVCKSCIDKTLKYYDVQNEEFEQYETIIKVICKSVTNFRQFKRLLNSSFITTFCYDRILYKPHLLIIETIRFLEPNLYYKIKNNGRFFISRDFIYSEEYIYNLFDSTKFNEEGKIFFDELFGKYPIYKEALAELFPYVKRYNNKMELKDNYYYDDIPEHKSISSIASAKFFDLYFSYGSNDYLRILESVDEFIVRINNTDNDVASLVENMIAAIERIEQREWFENLQNKVDDIVETKKDKVAIGIGESINEIDSSRTFGVLSAKQRATVVMTILLKDLNYDTIKVFLDKCAKKYNVFLLGEIVHYCSVFEKNQKEEYSNLKQLANIKYKELCRKIIEENINIYNDELYQKGNIWALYRSFSDEEKEIIHKYMLKIINNNNIFMILKDVISESVGSMGYGYSMIKNYIIDLFGDINEINEIMSKIVPKNEKEKLIWELWKRMEENQSDENELYFSEPLDL